MKLLFLTLSMSLIAFFAKSQIDSVITVNDYLARYSLNNTHYNYVYLYKTQAGKQLKYSFYFEHEGKYKLAVFERDTFKFEKTFTTDVIFPSIEANLNTIKQLERPNNREIKLFRKNFEDLTKPFQQLGIRYKDLHNNHFQKKSESEIASISKKEKQVLIARLINSLYEWVEKNQEL